MYGHSWRCDRCGHQPDLAPGPAPSSYDGYGDSASRQPPIGWAVAFVSPGDVAVSVEFRHLCPICAENLLGWIEEGRLVGNARPTGSSEGFT